MISDITPKHYAQILRINTEFVHWLAPLEPSDLQHLISLATYAKQIDQAQAILIGYPHDVDYPDHWNLTWLRKRFDNFFYIDRIIVDGSAQGQKYGQSLYADVADFARIKGYNHLCCEVNTLPDNPGSHKFHTSQGFVTCGEQKHESGKKAVRYYAKAL